MRLAAIPARMRLLGMCESRDGDRWAFRPRTGPKWKRKQRTSLCPGKGVDSRDDYHSNSLPVSCAEHEEKAGTDPVHLAKR